jgi:hypothetical protein
MVTPAGPACDHCHRPFGGQPCVVSFFCCQFRYCGRPCPMAAEEGRKRRWRAGRLSVGRHRKRHWKMADGNGEIVCATLCRKGAEEVGRRLSRRRLPPFPSGNGASVPPRDAAPAKRPSARHRRSAKAA